MRRILALGPVLLAIAAGPRPAAAAPPPFLEEIDYRYDPDGELVFVAFANPHVIALDHIAFNMMVPDGPPPSGHRHRPGRLPANLILRPGEPTSARVPLAVLTFYDARGRLTWSERVAVDGTLTQGDALLVSARLDTALAADLAAVEVHFVTVAVDAAPGR